MKPRNLQAGRHQLSAAVSGSFHRHMERIAAAVHELVTLSIRVLSPADPQVVAQQGGFLFVASDRVRSVRLVQDRHLESIRAANFVWLVCPDGYVGQSASMEIGFAAAVGVPVYSTHAPSDLTLRQYVTTLTSLGEAVRAASSNSPAKSSEGILIDPHASVEEAHRILERVEAMMTRQGVFNEPERAIRSEMTNLQTTLKLPAYTH